MIHAKALSAMLILSFCAGLWSANTARGFSLDLPGFSVVNQFQLPSGPPADLGDVMFSADGNTLFILSGSESLASEVWSVPVTRDANGTVTGLGPATFVFASPFMDTSLEVKPGTDTLFFRNSMDTMDPMVRIGGIGQRRPDGTVATFALAMTEEFGGLAFVPEPLPNAGNLLVGSWDSGVINIHSLTDNLDDTFTPGTGVLYANSEVGAAGDMHFIPSSSFPNDLMFTNWTDGTVSIIDIDPVTGLPVGGGTTPSITRFASGLGMGPWGLEFDPITNNLFLSTFQGDPADTIIQVSGFAPIPEPSTLFLLGSGLAGLGHWGRRRRRTDESSEG